MFWKKTNKKSENPNKLFEVPEEEIRESFRVAPSREAPIELILDNKPALVLDISSGGLCCKNSGFEIGGIYSFQLILPGIDPKISGNLVIREVSEKNHCRCKFQSLSMEFQNHIHRYTLNRQKEELENRNKRSNT